MKKTGILLVLLLSFLARGESQPFHIGFVYGVPNRPEVLVYKAPSSGRIGHETGTFGWYFGNPASGELHQIASIKTVDAQSKKLIYYLTLRGGLMIELRIGEKEKALYTQWAQVTTPLSKDTESVQAFHEAFRRARVRFVPNETKIPVKLFYLDDRPEEYVVIEEALISSPLGRQYEVLKGPRGWFDSYSVRSVEPGAGTWEGEPPRIYLATSDLPVSIYLEEQGQIWIPSASDPFNRAHWAGEEFHHLVPVPLDGTNLHKAHYDLTRTQIPDLGLCEFALRI